MEITFLGTSAMQPTKDRNPSSIFINHKNQNILIDCGEGTQRQLQIANISPTKITKILISHWHGDHVLGLPGLIMTLAASEYTKKLEIYGPKGTKKYMNNLLNLFITKNELNIEIKELKKEEKFLETKDLLFSNFKLNHSTDCLGYVIKEKNRRKMKLSYLKKFGLTKDPILGRLQQGKNINYKGHKILVNDATDLIIGKKISIVSDTTYTSSIIKNVKNSDILIIESTYSKELIKKAKEYKHLTSEQAAKIAKQANVKQLILTHIGKRFKNTSILLKEAKEVFKNTKIAKDFLKIKA